MDSLKNSTTVALTSPGGEQADNTRIKRLNRLIVLLVALLALVGIIVVFRFVSGQFAKPRTYYENQLQTWNQVLAKKPKDAVARTRIGYIYLKMGRIGQGISQFEAVLKDQPKFIPAHYYMGIAYQMDGDLKKAEKYLVEAIDLTKNDQVKVFPAFRLAGIYKKQGRTDLAIKYFEIASKGEPLLWNPHFELGELYSKKGDLNRALAEYEQAARFNTDKKIKKKIDDIKDKLGK